MINYLKNIVSSIKEKTLKTKISLIVVLILYLFFMITSLVSINVFVEDDYTSTTPGVVNKVSNSIKVDSNFEAGDVYTISVYTYRRMSLIQYWLSKLDANTDVDVDYESEFSDKELTTQGQIMKDVSVTNSVIVAFVEAAKVNPNVSIDYEYQGYILHTVHPFADKQLKQGDVITKVEGETFANKQEFETLLRSKLIQDKINLSVKRGTKVLELQVNVHVQELDNKEGYSRSLGINGYSHYKINTTSHEFELSSSGSIGPSGGLMQSIAIYNALTRGDITNGKRIMGTGTIEIDSEHGFGYVGAIGGVEQKIVTANIYKADVVLIPTINYSNAVAQYEKINNPTYKKPIEAKTFAQVIQELKDLGGKNE